MDDVVVSYTMKWDTNIIWRNQYATWHPALGVDCLIFGISMFLFQSALIWLSEMGSCPMNLRNKWSHVMPFDIFVFAAWLIAKLNDVWVRVFLLISIWAHLSVMRQNWGTRIWLIYSLCLKFERVKKFYFQNLCCKFSFLAK